MHSRQALLHLALKMLNFIIIIFHWYSAANVFTVDVLNRLLTLEFSSNALNLAWERLVIRS